MADDARWPALLIRADPADLSRSPDWVELVSAVLDDFSPLAIHDLADVPLPPGGLWDPTHPPIQEPPPAALHWRAFFRAADDRDAARTAIAAAFPALGLQAEEVPDDDWAARSQRGLTAVTAGAFVVAPPWAVPAADPDGPTIIVIEPSRGFGTGHHASTRLCLRALSDTPVRGRRVLDIGTGSGVLAMAAALRGAAVVTAIDVDADAIAAARESARLNAGVAQIDWVIGDIRDPHGPVRAGHWDVVLANLTGGMLMAAAARLRDLLAPGGLVIASGFDRGERPQVEAALGLSCRSAFDEDDWVGLVLARGGEPS